MNQFANSINQPCTSPETEISAARRQLEEVLSVLPNIIEQLESRLQSVLVPRPPAEPQGAGRLSPMLATELGNFLDTATGKAGRSNATLQDLIDRLRL